MTTRAGAITLGLVLAATAAPAADVRLGVLGAANFADIDLNDPELVDFIDFQTLNRWGAGGVLEIGLTENLSVVALPMYLGKGTKAEELGAELRFELTYFEVPVLLKYAFGSADTFRPYVSAGPSLGFRDNAEVVLRALGQDETEDVSDQTKSTDFSLWFGAGLEIPAGGARVFVEGGYALGLTDIEEDSFTSAKNRGFQARAGVTFGI